MDANQEMEESISTEELEAERRKLLALKEALASDEESSEESGTEESEDEGNESEEESNSANDDDDNTMDASINGGDISEKEDEEMECPAKRAKLDDSSDDEESTQSPGGDAHRREEIDGGAPEESLQPTGNDNRTCPIDSLKRKKRIPEYPAPDIVLPLPTGWVETIHDAGIPIYMHMATRVVTFSRPYEIKRTESFRRHSIPLASIPCQQQRRMTEHREQSGRKLTEAAAEITVPQVELKTMDQFREDRLSPEELYEKAKETFHIKEIMVFKHNDWKTIRKAKKQESMERAMMEESTIDMDVQNPMITVAAGCGGQGKKIKKRGYVLNVVGKTSVALLHEYVPKVLKGSIEYTFTDVKSAINPYSAMCYLKSKKETAVKRVDGDDANQSGEQTDDTPHLFLIGKGSGDSRKKAKRLAASEALRSLIPGIKINDNNVVTGNVSDQENVEAFDMLAIDDEKVIEYSRRIGRELPYHILLESIRMNAAWGATKPEETNVRLGHSKYELTMRVGKHEARVECTSLKNGRHRVAQALLKMLHPGMDTWGSVFRLFSHSANDDLHETKRVRDQVVKLAPNAGGKEYARNDAVLQALRSEMERASTRLGPRRERERRLKESQPLVHEVLVAEEVEEEEDEDDETSPQSIDLPNQN